MQAEIKDAEWWESCKVQFKRLIILHSCRLSQNYRAQLQALEAELRVLQAQALRNPGSNAEEIKIIKKNLKVKFRTYFPIESQIFGHRGDHVFLFSTYREKQNAAKSTINELSISSRI